MREPSPHTSRMAIAGGIAIAAALVGAGYVAGRSSAPMSKPPAAMPEVRPVPVPATAPTTPAVLKRADLLAIAAQSADAFASDMPMPASVDAAAGRRFDLVLPFGCNGPDAAESSGAMLWRFDPETATLRVTAKPVIWKGAPWSAPNGTGGESAFQGFWIAKPWSSAMRCVAVRGPTAVANGAPIMPPDPTVAIVRPISLDAGGKIRPYEVVQRLAAADLQPNQGFQLRIIGRIRSASEGGSVMCQQSAGAEQPPQCLIVATFSEVRIENPNGGAVLARWAIDDDVRETDKDAGLNAEAGRATP